MAVLMFALSRITNAELTEYRYAVPDRFDFSACMGSHFGIMRDTAEHRVSIRFFPDAAPFIRKRIWHESQSITEEKNGGIILYFTANSLREVKSWILSYGSSARVLKPVVLANEIRKELRMSLKNYQLVPCGVAKKTTLRADKEKHHPDRFR